MLNYLSCSKEVLLEEKAKLESTYNDYVSQHLKLDMSRGKPAGTQLDLTNDILDKLEN